MNLVHRIHAAVDRSRFFDAPRDEATLELSCPMPGAVQARNMALAALVARSSSFSCSSEAIVAGLSGARLRARWILGSFATLSKRPAGARGGRGRAGRGGAPRRAPRPGRPGRAGRFRRP